MNTTILEPKKKLTKSALWRKRRHENAFAQGMKSLSSFVNREGTADVHIKHVEDGFPLGYWVANQRAKYRRGEGTEKWKDTLELQPGWVWSVRDRTWDQALACLKVFRKRVGHARVPLRHFEDGFALGSWAARQRARFKSDLVAIATGKHKNKEFKFMLSDEKRKLLAAIPEWDQDWKTAEGEKLWEDKFAAVLHFSEKNGHANISRNFTEDGLNIGVWCNSVRTQHNKGLLSVEKTERLESIPGWSWGQQRAKLVMDVPQPLREFVNLYGHARVPRTFKSAVGIKLGEWVSKRRSAYRLGKLTSHEILALEALPGWSWMVRQPKLTIDKKTDPLKQRNKLLPGDRAERKVNTKESVRIVSI